jgi:hypothetical protein
MIAANSSPKTNTDTAFPGAQADSPYFFVGAANDT